MAQRLPIAALMTQRAGMDPLNIIKGRIAEALVEELLKSCGNNVYRFGYESLLQNLVQFDPNFDRKTKNGQQVPIHSRLCGSQWAWETNIRRGEIPL